MSVMITGTTVITVDPGRRILSDAALVVRGERIVDVGPTELVEPRHTDVERRIDGRGKVVLPGFVSVHNHLGYAVFRGRAEDIGHGAVNGLYVPMSTILAHEERAAIARLATAELLRGGVTTVVQMEEDAEVTADFVEHSGMRALLGLMAHDIDVERLGAGETIFDERVRAEQLERAAALAEHVHGRACGRLGAVLAANTVATSSAALLRGLRDVADRLGVPVSIHMGIGEAEEARRVHGTGPFQFARDHGFLDERALLVHCYVLGPGDVDLVAASGAALAHCPLMNQFRGAIAPAQDMRARGIPIGLGIDNYFSDHFEVLRACVAAARIHADDPSVLPSEAVLARATIESASVLGLGDEIGSLEVGKKADLQIIDTRRYGLTPINEPVRTLVYHGHAKDVELVMVDGRIVVEDGIVTGTDEAVLIDEAARAAERAWARFAAHHGGYTAQPPA